MTKARRFSVLPLFIFLITACSPPERGAKTADDKIEERLEAQRRKRLENLKSLPYVHAIPIPEGERDRAGVTRHDPSRSCPGLNLFNPRDETRAFLMDMDGSLLHEWQASTDQDNGWQHIEMAPGGDLLAIVKDHLFTRLDWSSHILWTRKLRLHHDIALAGDGAIYAPTRSEKMVWLDGAAIPILDDYVGILTPSGLPKQRISLFEMIGPLIPEQRIVRIRDWIERRNLRGMLAEPGVFEKIRFSPDTPPDVFHLNAIEIIDRDIPGLCGKNDLLISVRELDTIAILNVPEKKILWSWGPGELEEQHHPSLLENGNILIFDNGVRRGFSRVIEVDPSTGEIVWQYRDHPPEDFFSRSRGSSQRLPNSNTLITESDKGRAFEVTRSGEVVWEFYAPIRTSGVKGKIKRERAPLYRMVRITDPATLELPALPRE